MKELFVSLILLLVFVKVDGQKTLSLKDAVLGSATYLRPSMPSQLKWLDNQHFIMEDKGKLLEYSLNNHQTSIKLTLEEVNKALDKEGINEIKSFPTLNIFDESKISMNIHNKLIVMDLTHQSVLYKIEYPDNAENIDFEPVTRAIAYTVENNLFFSNEKRKEQITFDSIHGIENGKVVHRNEFGIEKGTFWSPSGNFLAFYRMDESMVEDYPLVDFMTREAALINIKYPMAGMKSHEVQVVIYDCSTKKLITLQTKGSRDHYLTNISWSNDEKSIYIAELNREQNHMMLNRYEVSSGKMIQTVLEEKNETYVEPLYPLVFSKIDPDVFYYQSRKDGWNHVYSVNQKTGKSAQLTKGAWEVTQLLGLDEKEEHLFIESTQESPIERHLYKINLKSEETTKLTKESGTHSGILSPDRKYLIDHWTSTSIPGQFDLIKTDGKKEKTFFEANNTLADYKIGESTVFTIKAADKKTDLYCRIIKPNNFDPAKKYPVIVYVYGGPHAQLVNKTWLNDARWWDYYMASKGYLVFTLDNRGSANRGQVFEDVIHRELGINETADQMEGIEYLKSLPFVDGNRIGVHGWSYGGFMTLNLMLRHPETFKVGVAGGPVVDWALYEVMYGERYMDTSDENQKGYTDSNMLNHVQNLKGKLMIIHGAQDPTVVMQNSMQFIEKCIDLNKQLDFFVYPIHEHNVRGVDRLHLMEKISQYFFDHL
jgi:dipeptidyl-peptidase-4